MVEASDSPRLNLATRTPVHNLEPYPSRPCGRTLQRLPPGAYTVYCDNCDESHFKPHGLNADELIEFSESAAAEVLSESRL